MATRTYGNYGHLDEAIDPAMEARIGRIGA